jgi:hypothetical protein
MAIDIADLHSKIGGSFHSYANVYQRVRFTREINGYKAMNWDSNGKSNRYQNRN